MPAPRNWIEKIHTRLLSRYGSAWINQYRDIDPELVIADWADCLNGFGAEAIHHALECLPDDAPPNAAQFARLCMRGPQSQAPALPWPAADPAVVAAVMGALKPPPKSDPKDWACRLQDREINHRGVLESGRRMTQAQRDLWRAAVEDHTEPSHIDT